MNSRDKTPSDWMQFARVGNALAFGFMAGSLQAFTRDAEGMRFDLGLGTVLAFILGAAIGWYYWQMAAKLSLDPEHSSPRAKRRFIIFSVLLFVAALLSYLYRIRFVSRSSSWEVVEGVLMAFFVVGMIGFAMWRIVRFLESK